MHRVQEIFLIQTYILLLSIWLIIIFKNIF